MISSVTNGAIIASTASKKHEKLPRGSSATMIVLPRYHREQHRNLSKVPTDDRENGANIPGGVSAAPSCSSLRLIACCESGEAPAQILLASHRLDSGL